MNLKSMPRLSRLPLLIMLVILVIVGSCSKREWIRSEGMIWNTTWHLTYCGEKYLTDSVLRVLDDVGKSLNVFDTTSLVSSVNRNCSLVIDDNFRRVYISSLVMNKISDGMFDPTVGPLVKAWGFGPGHVLTADTAAVDSMMNFIGINRTRLEADTLLVKSDQRIQFNFSAIAKGYACDRVGEMLRRNGVENFLIEIGGELALGGISPKGGNWKISIDKPIVTDSLEIHDALEVVELTDCGMATSGNYRNFRSDGGKKYGHTISPVSGRPVDTDVISATIIAPTAMEADAAATACMAAGSRMARKIIEELGFKAMLVLSDSTIWTNSTW